MPVGSTFQKNDQDIPNLKSAKKQRRPSSAGGTSSLLALDTLNNKSDNSNKEEQSNHSASEANRPKSLKSAESQEQTKETVEEEGTVPQLEEDEKKDFRNPLPPPNPLLPRKNIQRADVPRSGTDLRFLKIPFLQGSNKATQAQGQDYGKYPKKCGISITEYPPHMTLNQIFFGWMNRIDQLASGQVPKGMSPVYEQGSPIVYRRDAGQIAKQTALQQENKVISTICDVRKLIKVTGDSNNNNDDDMSRVSSIPPVFSDNIRPYYVPKDQSDRTLVFESRFQSGNLAIALKANDNEYNLLLQNDINTQGHTQWFFFSVGNTKKSMEVKFNILNLCKSDSLYNHGMKVLAFSVAQKQKSGLGWHRDGKDILYYLNGIKRDNVANYKSYYTLTFTYKFKYTQDTVYFAYSLPYTYSQLQEYLLNISTDPKRAKILNRKTLCNTIAGNKSEILTVTQVAKTHQQGKKKKGVVISSRVHPGQTVGSWMMQGVMEFICSLTSYQAYILRKHFIFKIIPMVNPDGVINGNYRCSLAGCDLNRRWKVPSKVLHPVIYQIKKLLRNMSREREVSLFCDLHGHSRNKNVFMYGCSEPNKLEETRIFPFIMSKLCPFFSFKGSKFGVQKSKQSTARITMWKELRVPNIFTMQASFCGPSEGEFAGSHFSENNLKQIGRDLCRSLLYYCEIQIPKQVKSDNKDLEQYKQAQKIKIFEEEYAPYKGMYDRLKNQLLGREELILAGQGGEESGSDDCPSQDNFSDQEIKKVLPKLQKRVKKDLTKKMANSLSKSKAPVIQPRPQPPVIRPQQSPQERKKPDPLRDRKPSTNPPLPEQRRNQTKRASVLDGTQSVPADKNAPKKSTMRDAWTQTDKSDIRYIKMKMGLLRYTPRSLSSSIARTLNSGSHSLRTHHQKMNTSYNSTFNSSNPNYGAIRNQNSNHLSQSPPHRQQPPAYGSGHYSDSGGGAVYNPSRNYQSSKNQNQIISHQKKNSQSYNQQLQDQQQLLNNTGGPAPDGYYRVFELHFPKVKPGQTPPQGQQQVGGGSIMGYQSESSPIGSNNIAAYSSVSSINNSNTGVRNSKGFQQQAYMQQNSMGSTKQYYRTTTPSQMKKSVINSQSMIQPINNASSSFDLKGQGRSVSPVNRLRQGGSSIINQGNSNSGEYANAAAEIIKRRNSKDKYKSNSGALTQSKRGQLAKSFANDSHKQIKSKLPQISSTKSPGFTSSASTTLTNNSNQGGPPKTGGTMKPIAQAKQSNKIPSSSASNSSTAPKRGSLGSKMQSSAAKTTNDLNIISTPSSSSHKSGVSATAGGGILIPNQKKFGEDLTQALKLAGVAGADVKEVVKKAAKAASQANNSANGASARGMIKMTGSNNQPTARMVQQHKNQKTIPTPSGSATGGKKIQGAGIAGQAKMSKIGSGIISGSLGGSGINTSGGVSPNLKGNRKGGSSITSGAINSSFNNSNNLGSCSPTKKGKKKKKGGGAPKQSAPAAGLQQQAKNVNINFISVQNDFQISNQIIIQSGPAPSSSQPKESGAASSQDVEKQQQPIILQVKKGEGSQKPACQSFIPLEEQKL